VLLKRDRVLHHIQLVVDESLPHFYDLSASVTVEVSNKPINNLLATEV
jgi:hypothetical protein